MLKACKYREPVNFSFGFSETPVVAAGQAEAFPLAGKTKSIFASDPPPAVTSPRGRVWVAAPPPRPFLILFAARLARTESRTWRTGYSLASMPSRCLFATHRSRFS